jgi:uncharacterized protein YfcZ (UPF0381/DUF406 family)
MHKIAKAVKTGNLEELKKLLEEDPPAIHRTYSTWSVTDVPLLNLAAYYNEPEIVKFLIDRGQDINKKGGGYKRTPLHYAAGADAYQAVDVLLDLGADASLTDAVNKAPYQISQNKGTADVLLTAYNECFRKVDSGEQVIVKPAVEKVRETTAAASTWKPGVTNEEIIFQRDMPELNLRLTETFNFAADLRILVASNLETGYLSQPETKLFSEIPKMVEQAREELSKLNAKAEAPKGRGIILKQ